MITLKLEETAMSGFYRAKITIGCCIDIIVSFDTLFRMFLVQVNKEQMFFSTASDVAMYLNRWSILKYLNEEVQIEIVKSQK